MIDEDILIKLKNLSDPKACASLSELILADETSQYAKFINTMCHFLKEQRLRAGGDSLVEFGIAQGIQLVLDMQETIITTHEQNLQAEEKKEEPEADVPAPSEAGYGAI